ncbi:MAG: tetratricopeptide repeat protein [Candidatus Korobacteraceae bacterium]
MAAIAFVENLYSYQRINVIPMPVPTPAEPDGAVLSQINALLTQAGIDYAARRYQTAIAEYQNAESLIFQHLDPSFGGDTTVPFPHDQALFDPLLSASVEWLNKLSPIQPTVPVVSRIPINHGLLGLAGTLDTAGLRGAVLRVPLAAAPAINARPPGPVPRPAPGPPPAAAPVRSFGLIVAGKLTSLSWNTGDAPPIDTIRQTLFSNRVGISNLASLVIEPTQLSEVATQLPHDYFFVVPVGLGDCYHQLGDFATAEQRYLQAATYEYLNTPIEVPFLWQRLAKLYLDWGNSLFRDGDPTDALPIFEKVVVHDATVPATAPLYATVALASAANSAKQVIAELKQIVAGQVDATKLNVNPLIAAAIVEVYQQELKIVGGPNFLGMPTQSVPIWTFDYLQAVAANFA